jgi:hypothetical protein
MLSGRFEALKVVVERKCPGRSAGTWRRAGSFPLSLQQRIEEGLK